MAEAHHAMSELGRLHRDGEVELRAAAVVEGAAHGLATGDQPREQPAGDAAAAATVARLLAAVSEPTGLAARGAAGVMVRALLDIAEAEEPGTVGAIASRSFPPRKGAILAVVAEPTPRPLDGVAAAAGAAVVREPRPDVEHALDEAEALALSRRR